MTKRTLLTAIAAVFSSLFVAAILVAGTTVPDTFEMKTEAYTEHTYHPATLTHKKHVEDYKIACGDCHHDDKGKPLTGLKEGDNVQKCIECHKIPGRKPAAKKGEPKLTDAQAREYHAEALHDNCKGCHSDHNKKVKKDTGINGTAPTSCNDCHPGGKIK